MAGIWRIAFRGNGWSLFENPTGATARSSPSFLPVFFPPVFFPPFGPFRVEYPHGAQQDGALVLEVFAYPAQLDRDVQQHQDDDAQQHHDSDIHALTPSLAAVARFRSC